MPFNYCQCCKINHEQGRGHIYSRHHIKKLQEWSERQKKRVDDCLLLAQNGFTNASASKHTFWCAFCGEEIKDEAPMIVRNCLDHLCSKSHIDKVYEFFRQNGTNNRLINQKWYYVGEPFRDEYIENSKSLMYHNKVSQSLFSSSAPVCGPSIPPPVNPVKPTIKRTKTDRTLEDFPLESLLQGPLQPDTYLQGKTFSTLQSASGILQNPSGYTETGRRVWGGGIVKLSMKEWAAWPIDLIFLHLQKREESVKKLIQQAESQKVKEIISQPITIHTVSASGSNLQCIPVVPSPNGNIHSMALPPWLSPGEDSKAMRQWRKQKDFEERYNKRLRALDVGVVRGKTAGQEWLPNFGGVWTSGSRQNTREGFRQKHGYQNQFQSTQEQNVVTRDSQVTSLSELVSTGGKGMSEEMKQKVINDSKKKVFEKIQKRMKNGLCVF